MTSKRQIRRLYDNDYTLSNTQRQELRHTHDGPEVTGPPKTKSKKKKFCKRNNWEKHEVELRQYYSWWHELTCIHCGKRFWGHDLERHPNIVDYVSEQAKLAYEDYRKNNSKHPFI